MTIKGKPTYFFTHDKAINSKKNIAFGNQNGKMEKC
jgi:hypothetical protein